MFRGWSRLRLHAASFKDAEIAFPTTVDTAAAARATRAETMAIAAHENDQNTQKENRAEVEIEKAELCRKPVHSSATESVTEMVPPGRAFQEGGGKAFFEAVKERTSAEGVEKILRDNRNKAVFFLVRTGTTPRVGRGSAALCVTWCRYACSTCSRFILLASTVGALKTMQDKRSQRLTAFVHAYPQEAISEASCSI